MEATRSVGKVIGRLVGTFAVLGTVLGLVGLAMLWQAGMFEEPEPGMMDFGAVLIGGMISLVLALFVGLGGILLAVVAGMYAARTFPLSRRRAALAGLGGGGLGHLAMGLSFVLIFGVGAATLAPDSGDAASSDEESSGSVGTLLESMLLAVAPAALVGAGAAAILHESPRGATVVAVRGGAGGRTGEDGKSPAAPRMVHEQTAGPDR